MIDTEVEFLKKFTERLTVIINESKDQITPQSFTKMLLFFACDMPMKLQEEKLTLDMIDKIEDWTIGMIKNIYDYKRECMSKGDKNE